MSEWTGKTPTPVQMRELLEAHARWLNGEAQGSRADLTRADLRGAVLRGAVLRGADLTGADLTGADLRGADLTGAVLAGADLTRADLRGADLRGAVLTGADLTGADLAGADLTRADLRGADLRGAVLTGAVLAGADLRGADLTRAVLRGAVRASLSILPAGDLIGWKSCAGGVLVKLAIPAGARRSNATGRKCRAEYVDVLGVIGADCGTTDQTAEGGAVSVYRVGERVIPDSWDDDWTVECGHGIHFFITREEAEAYR